MQGAITVLQTTLVGDHGDFHRASGDFEFEHVPAVRLKPAATGDVVHVD